MKRQRTDVSESEMDTEGGGQMKNIYLRDLDKEAIVDFVKAHEELHDKAHENFKDKTKK